MKLSHLLFVAISILGFGGCLLAQQTYHLLDVIPNQAGTLPGEICFLETTGYPPGPVQGVCIKAPASITTTFDITLPNALPTSTTRCLEMTTGGIIQYAAGVCGTAGASFYNTMRDNGVDETQRAALNFVSAAMVLSDDAGNDETEFTLTTSPTNAGTLVGTGRLFNTTSPVTGGGDLSADRTIACATCVTTNTAQTITATKTWDGANVVIEDAGFLEFRDTTGTLIGHRFKYGGANVTRILDSSNNIVVQFNSDATPDEILFAALLYPNVTNTFDLGFSSLRWKKYWGVDQDLSGVSTFGGAATFDGNIFLDGGNLTFGTHNLRDIGSSTVLGRDAFFADFHAGKPTATRLQGRVIFANTDTTSTTTASLIGIVANAGTASEVPAIEADNLKINASGTFFIRPIAGDVTCTNLDDGQFNLNTSAKELSACISGTTHLSPLITTSFTPLAVTCTGAQILCDAQVENGILVGGNCANSC